MKSLSLAMTVLVGILWAPPVSACELFYRATFPTSELVRLTGIVVGYVDIAAQRPTRQAEPDLISTILPRPAGLRVAIREVVSGPVNGTETIVAVLPYGNDCVSFTANRDILERDYPVGSNLAVRGRATGSPEVPVIAEANQYQFVVTIRDDLPRTAQGDLDVRKTVVANPGADAAAIAAAQALVRIVEFECDRAVLTLTARPGDRAERLRNLAGCRMWRGMPDGLTRFRQLVAESGLAVGDQERLLAEFQQLHPSLK
jgi:hypothetical protein